MKIIFVAATQTRRHKLVVRHDDDDDNTTTTTTTRRQKAPLNRVGSAHAVFTRIHTGVFISWADRFDICHRRLEHVHSSWWERDDYHWRSYLVINSSSSYSHAVTPCDFSVWGIIKDYVYARQPRDLAHLRELIIESSERFTPDFCAQICRSVPTRLEQCIAQDGFQFENVYDWMSKIKQHKTDFPRFSQ